MLACLCLCCVVVCCSCRLYFMLCISIKSRKSYYGTDLTMEWDVFVCVSRKNNVPFHSNIHSIVRVA